jgi:hypothetical protein
MKRTIRILALAGAVLGLAACATTVRERVVVREQAAPLAVRQMPAPIREDIPRQPGPGYAWVQGHWAWHANGWAWQSGHWYLGAVRPMPQVIVEEVVAAPGPGHYWVPGHWVWRGTDWEWVKGHWRR